jgi:hypothetical protein
VARLKPTTTQGGEAGHLTGRIDMTTDTPTKDTTLAMARLIDAMQAHHLSASNATLELQQVGHRSTPVRASLLFHDPAADDLMRWVNASAAVSQGPPAVTGSGNMHQAVGQLAGIEITFTWFTDCQRPVRLERHGDVELPA